MQFCKQCDNMYYLKVVPLDEDSGDRLMYYCRNCGDEENNITKENMCVSKTVIKHDNSKFENIVNEYTKQDPTLPRTNAIRCPNVNCDSNNSEKQIENEILYMRFDNTNMKYIYMCVHCDTTWKTDN